MNCTAPASHPALILVIRPSQAPSPDPVSSLLSPSLWPSLATHHLTPFVHSLLPAIGGSQVISGVTADGQVGRDGQIIEVPTPLLVYALSSLPSQYLARCHASQQICRAWSAANESKSGKEQFGLKLRALVKDNASALCCLPDLLIPFALSVSDAVPSFAQASGAVSSTILASSVPSSAALTNGLQHLSLTPTPSTTSSHAAMLQQLSLLISLHPLSPRFLSHDQHTPLTLLQRALPEFLANSSPADWKQRVGFLQSLSSLDLSSQLESSASGFALVPSTQSKPVASASSSTVQLSTPLSLSHQLQSAVHMLQTVYKSPLAVVYLKQRNSLADSLGVPVSYLSEQPLNLACNAPVLQLLELLAARSNRVDHAQSLARLVTLNDCLRVMFLLVPRVLAEKVIRCSLRAC